MGDFRRQWLAVRMSFLKGLTASLVMMLSAYHLHAGDSLPPEEKISVVREFATIKEVLKEIERQTTFRFFYNHELVNVEKGISVHLKDVVLSKALNEIFEGTSIGYRIVGRQILLFKEEDHSDDQGMLIDQFLEDVTNDRLAFSVSGMVTSDEGEPLPAVNILQKGTSNGTATDVDGKYAIELPGGDATLVFSFIGYASQEVSVNGRSVINVTLEEDVTNLEEVVVVGYGVQRKSDITGAVGTVSKEDLQQPTFNVLQSLRGKVAGVNIFTNSGSPTGSNRVIIRGVGTVNASSNPLYVVDGVVMENIDAMNPNDIKRVEVLKDASSTAIYGARGANGVILITTERGREREGVTVGYRADFSTGRMRKPMDAMNAAEFMQVQRIGFQNAPKYNDYAPGDEPVIDLSDPRLFDAEGNPIYDTDWQKEATRTALSQNHQLSIQSAGDKSSFGAFLNYSDREGIILNSWMKRANVKLVFDAKPKEWLTIGSNLLVNRTWENAIEETGGGMSLRRALIEMPPIFPVKWPDGSYANSTQATGFTFEGMSNPVHQALEQDRLRDRIQLFGNAFVAFQITPNLEFRTQFGIDDVQYEARDYFPRDMVAAGFPDGVASLTSSRTTYWQNENFLTYLREIGLHRINSILGASWQQRSYKNHGITARGFSDDFFRYNNFGTATTPSAPTSTANDWTMNSYFTRLSYTYDNRYSLTFTGRVDGSSRFGANSKYGFFPSAGLGWQLSNEGFMSGVRSIDHLRLRTSYGVTGNTEIGLYQSLGTIGIGTTLIGGNRQTASYVQRLPNPDLEWEKTYQFDIGVELDMFNQLISLEADYYYKLTNDLLLQRPIPTTSGFGSIMDNIGSISNRGVDFIITTRNVRKSNFSWTTTLNFNYNKNRVESLGVNNEDIFPGPFHFDGSSTVFRVGEPIGSFWGYRRLGIWGTDEVEEAKAAGRIPGMIKRSAEKEILGKSLPDVAGSFINRFHYGNFDFTVDLQFVYGSEVEEMYLLTAEDRQALVNGLSTQLYQGWTETNQNTMVPQIRHTVLSGQDLARDSRWITDGSYLRGNMFMLGYTFNRERISALGLRSLRLTASLENAFVIHSDKFQGYDPEGTHYPGNQFGQNIFFYQYPKPRTFTLGLNVQF